MNPRITIIESRILHDWEFCKKCLLKVYEKQTEDEQQTGDTHYTNGIGFNKADAVGFSTLAEYLKDGVDLVSPTVKKDIQRRMLKYSRQLTTLLTLNEIET